MSARRCSSVSLGASIRLVFLDIFRSWTDLGPILAHLSPTWPPRRLQDAPETAQDASKGSQDAAKMPSRASKTPPRASTTLPRASKMPPRRAQDASKSPQVYTFELLYLVCTSGNQSAKCGRGDPFLCFEMKLSLSGSSFFLYPLWSSVFCLPISAAQSFQDLSLIHI